MALTTVAELRSTLGVGTLYPDATLQEVADAADAVLIPMLWAPKWFSVAHSNVVGTGTLYFNEDVRDTFYVGQSVTIANSGNLYAGTKTITAVGEYSISVTTTHSSAQSYHPIFPYGTVSTTTYTDWTTDTAVQNAALMIAVEIWRTRTRPSLNGGIMPVAITTLRTTLATALVDNSKWQTFAFPPATVLANSVIVSPDDPYLTPSNNQHITISPMANFKIIITVPLFDNEGNLNGIEDAVCGVFAKLAASSLTYNVSAISAPSILNAASGDLLSCEMSVSILTSWS